MLSTNNILVVKQDADVPRLIYFGRKYVNKFIKPDNNSPEIANNLVSNEYQDMPINIGPELVCKIKTALICEVYSCHTNVILLDYEGIVYYLDRDQNLTVMPFVEPIV